MKGPRLRCARCAAHDADPCVEVPGYEAQQAAQEVAAADGITLTSKQVALMFRAAALVEEMRR